MPSVSYLSQARQTQAGVGNNEDARGEKTMKAITTLLAVLLACTIGAHGHDWPVDPNGATTIQDVLDDEDFEDGDRILLLDGVFSGAGNRNIVVPDHAFIIKSVSEDPTSCIIDCSGAGFGASRAFLITGERTVQDVVIEHITIRNGYVPHTSSGTGVGGAIYCDDNSAYTLNHCLVYDNFAYDGGGALYFGDDCEAYINNCQFYENESVWTGGAILCVDADEPSGVGFTYCTIDHNTSFLGAGAVAVSGSLADFAKCTIANNQSTWGAGGIDLESNSEVYLSWSILAFGEGTDLITCDGTSEVFVAVSDIYDDCAGQPCPWPACVQSSPGQNCNISADPSFCEPNLREYTLNKGPCANVSCNNVVDDMGAWDDVATCSAQGGGLGLGSAGTLARGNEIAVVSTIGALGKPEFRFTLPRAADEVAVKIVDISGRTVRTLSSASLSAGEHSMAWDGRTDSGQNAPAGVYLFNLSSEALNASGRCIVLR